ncbi:restriction endonuclease subunit S [Acetobacter cerevisiae]|uniref:Restriction endonuclease subunit S n=1 Tax=Acetobacter cerevisiae TaxID=178900 RepID=A0ABT1EVA3_9PROT|nr:restriction endonuclease subunit S [Acetobacter cerevisiae]MCP1247301.1 restriction endonuclease subunit S [Acetobacter cerevisiae]MCP1256859.1 restriction endonuclease subunit S [Acetobacter cerevisiae]
MTKVVHVQKTSISALCAVSTGWSFRGRIDPTDGAKTAVVQMRDTSPSGVDWTCCVRTEVTGRREPDWLRPGDILFPARGNVSQAVLIDESIGSLQAVAAPHFFLLRVTRSDVLPAYLAWWLNQEPAQRHLEQQAQSSTLVRNIARPVLEATPVVLPPLPRQEQIVGLASVMRREEDLLQRLRQTNQQIMTGLARDLLAG